MDRSAVQAAGDTLAFSFTQDGQAIFARVPEAPPPAPLAAVAAHLVSDPAFDQFDGPAPGGWTVDSWNQEFLQERFGRAEPGRDGRSGCPEDRSRHASGPARDHALRLGPGALLVEPSLAAPHGSDHGSVRVGKVEGRESGAAGERASRATAGGKCPTCLLYTSPSPRDS